MAKLWLTLHHRRSRYNPSTAVKFAIALLLIGAGFLCLVTGIRISPVAGMMSVGWLALNYLLQTLGELALSPIGLAAVTALAPRHLVGMVMGLWFLSLSAAYAIAGKISDLTAIPKGINNLVFTAHVYQANFLHFSIASICIGLLLFLLSPILKRMMQE